MARQATAYHEAGHAVAAFFMEKPLTMVTIQPDRAQASSGHCHAEHLLAESHPDYDDSDEVRMRIEREVFYLLAGYAVQRAFNPRSCRHYHASEDHHGVVDLLSYVSGSNEELTAYLKLMEIRVRQFVAAQDKWIAISALASALLDRTTLTGEEASNIIRKAL